MFVFYIGLTSGEQFKFICSLKHTVEFGVESEDNSEVFIMEELQIPCKTRYQG